MLITLLFSAGDALCFNECGTDLRPYQIMFRGLKRSYIQSVLSTRLFMQLPASPSGNTDLFTFAPVVYFVVNRS